MSIRKLNAREEATMRVINSNPHGDMSHLGVNAVPASRQKVSVFADIRIIEDHQVLVYTEANSDGCFVHILYRLKNGTNIGMKMTMPTEKKMWAAFRKISKGGSDKILAKQILKFEKEITVTRG